MEMLVVIRIPKNFQGVKMRRLSPIFLGSLMWIILSGCGLRLSTETQVPAVTPGNVEVMGYIENLNARDGSLYITFDQAEWLDGAEAERAIREDGLCADPEHGCEPPNNFYIRNQDDETVVFRVSEQVVLIMQTLSHLPDGSYNSDEMIDINKFRRVVRCACSSHLRSVPYWITVENGVVTAIKEQYVP